MELNAFLNSDQTLIIDGGLSNVLESQGCDLNHKLWTAQFLDQNPHAIEEAHVAYLKSGAQCITTASYQASIPGLMSIGYDHRQAKLIILKSVQLAERAIERALDAGLIKERPFIAASIGPYGAYLADGSEYRGNYGVSDVVLRDFHVERIKILDQSNADILACETIPDLQETRILSDLLKTVDKPAWISFSCKDEQHVNDGSKINECVSLLRNHPKVFAVGANCTNPSYISRLIQNLHASGWDRKIIAYPNSGEVYDPLSKTWYGSSDPDHFVEMSKEWLKMGLDLLGGCCRIGPYHIERISQTFKEGS